MSAMDKEKIFVELRKYHTDAFSEKLSTEKMNELRKEFTEIEDGIVNMLLNLVNGKMGFVDFSNELISFKNKVRVTKSSDRTEDKDRNFFVAKIEHLNQILAMAKAAVFRLKIPRVAKVAKVH